jgi:peptide/nickel transport system substrate-binding protein
MDQLQQGALRAWIAVAFLSITLLLLTPWGPAAARDLRVGVPQAPGTADPHADVGPETITFNVNVYEALTGLNQQGKLSPLLATSWKPDADGLSWIFELRRGVKFQDGSDFTSEDVIASVHRARGLEAPNPFGGYISTVTNVKADGPYTVIFQTAEPDPILPEGLGLIAIMTAESAEGTTEDFNQNKFKDNSTAPYRLVRYTTGEGYEAQGFAGYWGDKPIFENVTFTEMPNPSTRVAALLAGDVDLIEDVPPADIKRLDTDPSIHVANLPSTRAPYIIMDQHRESSPGITDKNGEPIKNPFLDWRVRRAVSLAIDRDAIVDKVMQGNAIKTSTIVPEGGAGWSPDLNSGAYSEYDPETARKLLAAAGYPDGFRVEFRFTETHVNAAQHAQAMAQMLARVGIEMDVQLLPGNLFLPDWRAGNYSMSMLSYSGNNLEPNRSILVTHHSKVEGTALGVHNAGRFVNPVADFYFDRSLTEMNPEIRETYYRIVNESVANQVNLIFTHFATKSWATRGGMVFRPYATEDSTRIVGVSLQ